MLLPHSHVPQLTDQKLCGIIFSRFLELIVKLGDEMATCSCDPLKKILRAVLLEAVKLKGDDEMANKLHLFYKSSVIRAPTSAGKRREAGVKLECRVGEDTLRTLGECMAENGGAMRNGLVFVGDNDKPVVGSDMVKSVRQDKFGYMTVDLDKEGMKSQIIKWMVTKGWRNYSGIRCHNQMYRIEVAMVPGSLSDCFMEYRKMLVAQAVTTILRKIGHQIDETHFTSLPVTGNVDSEAKNIILVAGTPKSDGDDEKEPQTIVPEVVLRADLGKVTADTPGVQDMLSKRLGEIKEIGEARRLEGLHLSSWVTSLDNLTRATLHYDLLYRPLEVDLQLGSIADSGQMNNNALFIMYNYSRILSILRKFEEHVENKEYPQLPDLDEVDFSGICEREEELQLLQLVMEWPRVMESAVNFVRFQFNLAVVCKYLLTLAKAFNNFYFQIVVLVPNNASHNFPVMMARVYLIRAICTVFEDCMDILQVNHASKLAYSSST